MPELEPPEAISNQTPHQQQKTLRFAIVAPLIAAVVLQACGGGGGAPAPQPEPQPPATYGIELHVTGLAGTGLLLDTNGFGDLAIPSDGTYSISGAAPDGTRYSVTILAQPTADPVQTCNISNGSGVVDGATVTNIRVECRNAVARFVYVPNMVSNEVSAFSIDAASGALTPVQGSPFPALAPSRVDHFATSVATVVDERFLYVIGTTGFADLSRVSYAVSAFRIDETSGGLVLAAGVPEQLDVSSGEIVVHPSGRFLLMHETRRDDAPVPIHTSMHVFEVDDASGDLTEISGSPFVPPPESFTTYPGTFDAAGAYYYTFSLHNFKDPFLRTYWMLAYAVDATTGAITLSNLLEVPKPRIWQAHAGGDIVIHPSGELIVFPQAGFLFDEGDIVHELESVVTLIDISPSAGLLSIDTEFALVQAERYFAPIYYSPDGTHVFLPDSSKVVNGLLFNRDGLYENPGQITVLELDRNTRTLTEIDGSPFSTNGNGFRHFGVARDYFYGANTVEGTVALLAIDPATGGLTHAAQSPFTPAIGSSSVLTIDPSGYFAYATDAEAGSISVYGIDDTTGELALIGSYATGAGPQRAVVIGLQ